MNLVTPKARAKHEPFVQQTGLRPLGHTLLCYLSQTLIFNKPTSGHVIIRVSAANLAYVNAPLGSLIPTKPFLSESLYFCSGQKTCGFPAQGIKEDRANPRKVGGNQFFYTLASKNYL